MQHLEWSLDGQRIKLDGFQVGRWMRNMGGANFRKKTSWKREPCYGMLSRSSQWVLKLGSLIITLNGVMGYLSHWFAYSRTMRSLTNNRTLDGGNMKTRDARNGSLYGFEKVRHGK